MERRAVLSEVRDPRDENEDLVNGQACPALRIVPPGAATNCPKQRPGRLQGWTRPQATKAKLFDASRIDMVVHVPTGA